jgi:hypothetical protein
LGLGPSHLPNPHVHAQQAPQDRAARQRDDPRPAFEQFDIHFSRLQNASMRLDRVVKKGGKTVKKLLRLKGTLIHAGIGSAKFSMRGKRFGAAVQRAADRVAQFLNRVPGWFAA